MQFRGATIDYETDTSHDLTIEVTDAGGNTFSEVVTIAVNDFVGAAPTDIGMAAGNVIIENAPGPISEGVESGSIVASVASVADADAGETFTYALTDDAAGKCAIDASGNISLLSHHDASTAATDTIAVEVTDSEGNAYSESIGITFGTSGGDGALSGINNDDVIHGFDGNDTLDGGAGNDVLAGGSGSDIFIFAEGDGSDTVLGGAGGGWTDAIQLQDAVGDNNIGTYGTDWTVTLDTGTIDAVNANDIDLSDDASGTITLQDGSEVQFYDIERIDF